jgi:hypothetical protein
MVPLDVIEALTADTTPSALAVYAVLAAHANKRGECWPAQSTIARLCGRTRPTVRLAVRELERTGFVVVLEPGKGRRATRYLLPDIARLRGKVSYPLGGAPSTVSANGDRPGAGSATDLGTEVEQHPELPVVGPPADLLARVRAGVWRGP